MPRNSLQPTAPYLLLAALAAGGCGAPKATPVTVDLARLLATEAPKVAASPPSPDPPKPAAEIVSTAPAQPAQTFRDPSRASEGSVRSSIERQQQEALRTLERRLREYYKTQAEQFQLEQEQGLEKTRATAYEQANSRIREAFVAYADARAPKVLRLTVLVGFPDPNPTSEPPRTPVKTYIQKWLDEAKQLRAELAALDREFEQQANTILASVTQATNEGEIAMRLKVEAFRNQLNERAGKEAQAEVRTSVKELGLQLTDPSPVTVPGTPARRVVIPAEAPLPPVPKVPSVGIPSGPADRRRLMEHELGIWLGLNRYRLEKGGQDKTKDFQAWRQKYRAGL